MTHLSTLYPLPLLRYARALLDRELAVLLLSEAMLLSDSEEVTRDKVASEEQLKKNRCGVGDLLVFFMWSPSTPLYLAYQYQHTPSALLLFCLHDLNFPWLVLAPQSNPI